MSTIPTSTLRHRHKRRLSHPHPHRPPRQSIVKLCTPLPPSLEALDLPAASPKQNLASLRFLVLNYLAELESSLSQVQSPTHFEGWKVMGEATLDEAKQRVQTAIQMLRSIRSDVYSHLP